MCVKFLSFIFYFSDVGLHGFSDIAGKRGNILSFIFWVFLCQNFNTKSWQHSLVQHFLWEGHCVLASLRWSSSPSFSSSAEDWGDQRCLTALPYVCKRANTTTVQPSLPSLPVPTPGSCPQGWHAFINKVLRPHYYNSLTGTIWEEYMYVCLL